MKVHKPYPKFTYKNECLYFRHQIIGEYVEIRDGKYLIRATGIQKDNFKKYEPIFDSLSLIFRTFYMSSQLGESSIIYSVEFKYINVINNENTSTS
jgi:hypothetical protein